MYVYLIYLIYLDESSNKSKLLAMLDKISDEELMSVIQDGPMWSESTLNKHTWVLSLYEPFCQRIKVIKKLKIK